MAWRGLSEDVAVAPVAGSGSEARRVLSVAMHALLPSLLPSLLACAGPDGLPAADRPADTDTAPAAPTVLPLFDGPPPTNILVLSVDTLRADHVAPRGEITPFLAELAAESLVLTDFTSCSDWTVAATACVLSGASNLDRAVDRGMVPILVRNVLRAIPPGEAMLPTWLGEAGFSSLLVTSNNYFSDAHGNAQGFDQIVWTGPVPSTGVWQAAVRRLDPAEGGTPLPSPWLLHLHFFEPHRPYTAPAEHIVGLEALPPVPFDLSSVPGQEAADRAMAAKPPTVTDEEAEAIKESMRLRYAGEVRWLDAQLREIWADLDARGLLDDTLVVFWTDHGEELWEHGPAGHGYLLHRGENDGAAMFWAKNIVPGVWDGPTQGIDLTPTLLELYGLERPETVTGLPIGTAPADRVRFAFSDGFVGPVHSVRRGSSLLQFRWPEDEERENLELYDLSVDPRELTSLYDPSAPSDEVRELWDLLRPQVIAAEPWVLEDPRGFTVGWPAGLPSGAP